MPEGAASLKPTPVFLLLGDVGFVDANDAPRSTNLLVPSSFLEELCCRLAAHVVDIADSVRIDAGLVCRFLDTMQLAPVVH